jgi:hypothetical protein
MNNTAYVACPSGYESWITGPVSCAGAGLSCCIKENVFIGTCIGKINKQPGKCYTGSGECLKEFEVKDGAECSLPNEADYRCCVPKP